MKKLLLLILVVLVGFILLSGCCCNFYGGYVTPPPPQPQCSLTVTAGYWVWGWIYINDQATGKWIDFEVNPSATIYNLVCNQTIKIYLIDNCGAMSRIEYIYIAPGANYLYFDDWYGTGAKDVKEGNSSRDCHDC